MARHHRKPRNDQHAKRLSENFAGRGVKVYSLAEREAFAAAKGMTASKLPSYCRPSKSERKQAKATQRHQEFQRELCDGAAPGERSLYELLKNSPAFPTEVLWNEPITVPCPASTISSH